MGYTGRGRTRFLAMILALLGAGCAGSPSPPPGPLEAYRFHQLQGSLAVAVEPLFAASQAQATFPGGEVFPQQGLLPVLVLLENRGAEPVVVRREAFRLIRPDGRTEWAMSPQEAFALVKPAVGWWAALPLFGTSAAAARNADRYGDFETRALRDGPVQAGGSRHGFLFFYLPEAEMSLEGSRVVLTARTAGGGVWGYEIPIGGRRDRLVPTRIPEAPAEPTRREETGGQGVIIRSPAP